MCQWPLFTRACVLGTQSCRWRCAPCCRRQRRLYASRCPELKRAVRSTWTLLKGGKGPFRWRVGCALLSAFELKRPSDRFTRTSTNVPKRPKTSQNVPERPKTSQCPKSVGRRDGRTRAPQPRRRSRAQLSERHSATLPRRVGRRTAAFGRQSCGTEGARLLIQDLAAAARQVSAARPMRAGVPSSDRAGWDRDARRKVPSRADGERSVALRSPSDRAARRRACADARACSRSPAPPQAAICPSWR